MTEDLAIHCVDCGATIPDQAPLGLCLACFQISSLRISSLGQPVPTEEQVARYGWVIQPGERLARGRFRLVEPLGEGGMGLVWLAVDEHLTRGGDVFFVALKFLAPQIRDRPEALDFLKREVLHSRRLNHPNIIRIYDWHEQEDEPVFFSMEYVRGWSVEALRAGQPAGLFLWVAILPWVRQLCAALEYAHGTEGIVHRDLKPGNLMVTHEGVLKLADFGLANPAVDRAQAGEERESGCGTPLFSSPEQMAGEPAALTDDIYSLGATLYFLLTGTPPFRTQEEIFAAPRELPQSMSDRLGELGYEVALPGHVKVAVTACLTPDPACRLQNMREVAGRLRLHRASEPVADQGLRPGRTTWVGDEEPKPAARNWAWLVLLLFLAGVGAAGWKWRGRLNFRPSTTNPTKSFLTNFVPPAVMTPHGRGRGGPDKKTGLASGSLLLTRAPSLGREPVRFQVFDADKKTVAEGLLSGQQLLLSNLPAGRLVVDAASLTDTNNRARTRVELRAGPAAKLALDFRPGVLRLKIVGVIDAAPNLWVLSTDEWGRTEPWRFKNNTVRKDFVEYLLFEFMAEERAHSPGEINYRFFCPGFHTVETNWIVQPGSKTTNVVWMWPDPTP